MISEAFFEPLAPYETDTEKELRQFSFIVKLDDVVNAGIPLIENI